MPRKFLIKYDHSHPTNILREEIAAKNKEEKVPTLEKRYNQVMPGFERNFGDLIGYDKRLQEVDPNNDKDDGWAEVREAQILARKKLLLDVELLDAITNAKTSSKRDKLRAIEQKYSIATEKIGPQDKGDTFNINTLIQVLTGNK